LARTLLSEGEKAPGGLREKKLTQTRGKWGRIASKPQGGRRRERDRPFRTAIRREKKKKKETPLKNLDHQKQTV